jgi:hypothetical protein
VKAAAEDHTPDRHQNQRTTKPHQERPADEARTPPPAALQRLQRGAGNRAVAGMMAKRRANNKPKQAQTARAQQSTAPPTASTQAPPAPETPATTETELPATPVQRLAPGTDAPTKRPGPNADPKFKALTQDVKSKQTQVGKHPPAKSEADASQAAAKPPQDDKEAQGKTANAEKMNAAKPGEFDKAAFVKAVNDAIAAKAPKNLDEADSFGDSGKADEVKSQVQGKVGEGKKHSAGQIESTTKAPPDTSKAKEKQVTPLKADQPPPTPGTPDPDKAVPDKAPKEATDFSDGPKQVDKQMADAEVTEDQLAKSNEPEFQGALKDKKEGEKHAETAPGEVRGKEAKTLQGAKAQAQQHGATAMTALATDRKQAGATVEKGKEGAKSEDEKKREQVTSKLQTVFDATKKDVEGILSGLDKKVDEKFTTDEKAARDAFTAEHKRKMDEYKDKRYSGFTGKLRWVKDKFAGLPDEANQIFVQARKGYVDRMQQVISGIADVIGADLTKAKQRIAAGRGELQAAVKSLSPDLQAIGKQAAGEFGSKFDELTESVDAKGKELVDTLATKYTDALKSVDDEIAAEKEKNKGFIAKAIDAVKGVIETIMKLKDLLMGILAKAAQAVMAIIKDPIGFLGKLVSAVGAGLKSFLANIMAHLKKGLVGWLMGNMASAGLELPAKFDLRGIILMIGSLLGLTWNAIRGRIVSRGVPEPAMATVEKSVPVAQKLKSEGIGGVWQDIKEKVGDLKANLFSKISEYLIPTVLIAGVTWIISLLNPASAFIKACKMIIDIVTFIVERGAQIVQFVNAVLDAVIAIAGGGAGSVPALIENALGLSVPVLIGALAAILGISGIAEKVKKFIQSLSKPVMKAVDWVVDKIVKFGKKIWSKLKSAGRKVKDKLNAAGKKVKDKFSRKDKQETAEGESPKDKARIAQAAADDAQNALAVGVSPNEATGVLSSTLTKWRAKGVRRLHLVPAGKKGLTVEAEVNPKKKAKRPLYAGAPPTMPELLKFEQVNTWEGYSPPTWARGSLTWNSGSAFVNPVSSNRLPKWAAKELASTQEGHAEEHVVNSLRQRWDAGGAHDGGKVALDIQVSRSSCVNCASHIVSFTKHLKGNGPTDNAVSTTMRFGRAYGSSRTQKVPQSLVDEHGKELIEAFSRDGKLQTTTPGRFWGKENEMKDVNAEQWHTVPGGPKAGLLGLAILRSAGIEVVGLTESELEQQSVEQASTEQRVRQTRQSYALDDAIYTVNQRLAKIQAS